MKKRIFCSLLIIALAVVMVGGIVACGAAPDAKEKIVTAARYDYDYSLVDSAGTNPIDVTNSQRAVLVEGFVVDEKGVEQQISASVALGWIYEKKYVVVPIQLFYVMDPMFGAIPAWQFEDVSFKAYLLPDSRVDDDWQKEELGAITVNEVLQLAVIERNKPVINVKGNVTIGKYEEISVGNVLYITGQSNARITVKPSAVSEIYTDGQKIRLLNNPGELHFSELGSLAFALRDGKLELVGFLCAMEPSQVEEGMAYIYYVDIQQVIDFIKTLKGSP